MSIILAVDNEDKAAIERIVLDDKTAHWLMQIADICHQRPAQVIAAMLQDIREDDEVAHFGLPDEVTLQ